LSHTATTQSDGSSATIKRLSEVIFIQVVRFWSQSSDTKKGFIATLNDKHLSDGLKAFHENYADEWTVEKLARESSMSRSLFSDRFTQYLLHIPDAICNKLAYAKRQAYVDGNCFTCRQCCKKGGV
jgi:transcriptional regulator GlxA family with amidase domain